MSTRIFCDICDQQIKEDENSVPKGFIRITSQKTRGYINLSVSASVNRSHSSYNSDPDPEHICLYCVTNALQKLDKRPKPQDKLPLHEYSDEELRLEVIRRTAGDGE